MTDAAGPSRTRLSILWVNQLDPGHPWAGGAERHIDEVGQRLVRGGHRVTLVSERFGSLPAQEERHGIEILRPVRRGLVHAWLLANAPSLIAERRVDVVVGDLSKVVPWGRRTLAGRPLVSVVRHLNGVSMFADAPFPTGPALWAMERLTPWFLGSGNLVTESGATADVLTNLGVPRERIELVPPGVDADRFHPDPSQRSPTPRIVYAGRLKRYKRVELALRAFALLRERVPTLEFDLAGGGSDHGRLRDLIERWELGRAVHLLGVVENAALVLLYQRAWVHVQPSGAEGWGYTAMESMACGTPVVACAGGALAATVGPACSDLLADQPTPDALAAALERGLARPESHDAAAAERLSAYARAFTWDRAATRYADVLHTAVERSVPGHPTTARLPWSRDRRISAASAGAERAERPTEPLGSG